MKNLVVLALVLVCGSLMADSMKLYEAETVEVSGDSVTFTRSANPHYGIAHKEIRLQGTAATNCLVLLSHADQKSDVPASTFSLTSTGCRAQMRSIGR